MKGKHPEAADRLAPAVTRRTVLGSAGLLAAPAIARAQGAGRPIKIGFVNPRTGPLAAFGEADAFVQENLAKTLAEGIRIGGRTHPVQILARDSQSSSSRAAEVASELILRDKVDLLTAASTPDTVNPVADQAEVNEVPCVTTNCPWQPYFFGRRGDPAKGFEWTYHFFWGLEDVIAAFTDLWSKAETNKVVGGLFPNDADGNAWGDAKLGLPPALAQKGYRLVDTGRFQPFSNDFSAQIAAFKAADVQIVTGVLAPPDFATFWSQAGQQGFRPKIATIGKALLFPSAVSSLGDRGQGLTTEIWWSPHHPFRSSLTGQTATELCDAYSKATGKPWTQPIGYEHALFEVALDVLKRAGKLEPEAILGAIRATDLRTIAGPVKWGSGPVKNVAKTPLVAGQWRRVSGGGLDLIVLANPGATEIPIGGTLDLLR
ncbi:ABC transporter substrate-binding protein [Roseomonas populi]|uniref:ABC transporter substrate-binding protein n=1 Tax=Roseomonas populi TaxID=3121582 RepID=A0ABT1X5H1_9PROT|nr:ABC transporter substrate-binding protein [Roseomonas pecuniae]MCR0983351.1 ABC transporter substrate-binding protein [Roseomonas pecuniae]